jgi:hypothetical protein
MTNTKYDDPSIRILKTAKCSTLSGSSTLTYQIGSKGDLEHPEIACPCAINFDQRRSLNIDQVLKSLFVMNDCG